MDNKKDKSDENKKEGGNIFSRNKLFFGILIIILAIIIAGIVALNYNNESNLNNSNNTTTNVTNITNVTNLTEDKKEGYSLVHLAGLDFYAPDKYLKNYKKGDYFDAFKNGKDYKKTLNAEEGSFERAHLNTAQIFFMPSGQNKQFKIEIFPKKDYFRSFDGLGINDKNFPYNRTIENLNIDGNNVKVIKTGKGFVTQNLGEYETYVYFELKDKSILIEFTNIPIDKYLIGSFFKLN